MAAAATRALSSSAARGILRRQPASLLSSRSPCYRAVLRHSQPRREYSQSHQDESGPKRSSRGNTLAVLGVGAAASAGIYLWYFSNLADSSAKASSKSQPGFQEYQRVYDVIAKEIEDKDDWDDGSYGPVLLRLAWHASGTYDKTTGTGGSNGATMRFKPESHHGANLGLEHARDFLEPVKQKFPWITHSDLWTLGGVCAIQEMQGPTIPWRPGRRDGDASACTPDGRLPDASQGSSHLRDIFYRMGFNDQQIVALAGAHALGRCHRERSGYDGPWTFSPTVLTNDYFKLLLEEKWQWRKWNGEKQYQDVKTKSLMMLPADMALVQDKKLRPYVEKYAADQDAFFKDFAQAVTTLFELGVPFKENNGPQERFVFTRRNG